METLKKSKPVRNFNYQRAERSQGRVFYHKLCLHCNGQYKSIRMDAAFCGYGCAKAARRKR